MSQDENVGKSVQQTDGCYDRERYVLSNLEQLLHSLDREVGEAVDSLKSDRPSLFDDAANRDRAIIAAELAGKREILNRLVAVVVDNCTDTKPALGPDAEQRDT